MSTSTIAKSAGLKSSCQIEDPVHVGPGCVVMADIIGRYCFVNANTCIFDNVEIGRFVTFARNCQIGGVEHPIHHVTTSFFKISRNWFPDDPLAQSCDLIKNTKGPSRKRDSKIVIGSDVWFGASAIVLKGIQIGTGAVVAAGAVVTKDVPPYAVVAGNPARLLRYRFDDTIIERLLASKWWDLDPERISQLPLDNVERTLEMLEE
ncbi:antibiotic acetyltransferase [Loktanella sp. D2R18]|uniref:xenobiotic acyltransferase family protein n=1 Tax=Rhodobacterales TaxID=204455 RepID=UPI000DE8DF52|nr:MULTISPECIES: CatB-related O-acetyltransferase [Rhodobacterales]MDO6589463.1 CatB-related O-acetyltransferase [Yoonia sp. 1_MG-2023]RBW44458.1 antibiotic acetyltransferase [Loktanella sp. D2R18]